MKKVVIIGGMAGGCKTAARLRRLDPNCSITIIERLPFVSFGTCGMPFFASGDIDSFDDLMKTPWGVVRSPEFFSQAKRINVLTNRNCIGISTEQQKVEIVDIDGNTEYLEYDYLVIATGSKPVLPRFPIPASEKVLFFHSPLDAKKFRLLAERKQIENAVIIGGGFVGCELAEAISSLWGIETIIIEKEDRLLPKSLDKEIASILENLFRTNGIEVRLRSKVSMVNTTEGKLVVETESEVFETDFVFLCLGVQPNVDLFKNAGIKIGSNGGITVNEYLQTNFENIYAVGDCIETINLATGKPQLMPLGSIANRQGRVVADNIAGRRTKFKGALGAISIKVFDTTFSAVGLNSEYAEQERIPSKFAMASFYDRPHYFPGSEVLFAKMIYNPKEMRPLGLQMCGKGEVNRYIDSFSALLSQDATIRELLDFEHSYTPPHSSPINPLNFLGGIAENQETFGIEGLSPIQLSDINFDGIVLDLRESEEIEQMPFPGVVINFRFGEYLARMDSLPRDKKILCVCQKGPRALESAISLKQQGFENVCYLAGGLQMLNSSF